MGRLRKSVTVRDFLRVLGCIYAAAFVSFGVQAMGLIGSRGILPAGEYLRTVREGAGAAALAAVLADEGRFEGRAVGLVLSGGNNDTRLLSSVLTRQLAREGRLSQLRLDIVDRPGQLAAVLALLSKSGANIVEVSHQRIFTDLPAKAVLLGVVIETRDRAHLAATIAALQAAGIDVDVGGH